jgi:hypothetical protein
MACLRLVTFLPERPDFSLPRFISCIERSTFLPAFGPYFRLDFFRPPLRRDVLREDDVRERFLAAMNRPLSSGAYPKLVAA